MDGRDEWETRVEGRKPRARNRTRGPWRRGIVRFFPSLLVALQASWSAAADATSQVRGPSSAALDHGVSAAVRDAGSKLSDAGCRQVFSDFRDAKGTTLEENLSALGISAQTYLSLMLFYDGHGRVRCDARGTLASTSPGSRVVYVCSPQFVEGQHRDPGLAAALIIHEELHSLGLGEDPPTSKEITARVISRCGK